MKKKLIALLLSCAMLTGILSGVASFADEADMTGGYEETLETSDEKIEDEIQVAEIVDGTADTATLAPSADPTTATTPETDASSDDDTDGEKYQKVFDSLMECESISEFNEICNSLDEDENQAFDKWLEENDKLAQLFEKRELLLSEDGEIVYEDEKEEFISPIDFTESAPILPASVAEVEYEIEYDNYSTGPMRALKIASANNDDSSETGLKLGKQVESLENGQYKIKLEAFSTGSKIKIETHIPNDIVLVLDQSGSMGACIDCNTEYVNGNWRKNYVKVLTTDDTPTEDVYFYYKQKNGNKYLRAYYCDGSAHSNYRHNPGWYSDPHFHYDYYKLNDYDIYIDGCTSANGEHTHRLGALTSALNAFADSVKQNSSTEVNNKIAIVGFSSDGYNNTELLTGVELSNGDTNYGNYSENYYYYPNGGTKINGAQKKEDYNGGNTPTAAQYASALQDMSTNNGQNNVSEAIDAITAHGGTNTLDGLEMAEEIFSNNPVQADTSGKPTRNRVVILFTDGDTNSDRSDVINSAYRLKKTYGATVYTVGIFSDADGKLPTNESVEKANGLMHRISSNYPDIYYDWDYKNDVPKAGTTDSYYLTASSASTLEEIFKSISSSIEGGSDSTLTEEAIIKDIVTPYFKIPNGTDSITVKTAKLINIADGEYLFADAVNTDLTPVIVETVDETTKETTTTVSVSGFDFSKHWCGIDENEDINSEAKKLIIEIIVTSRDGFLGGNGVPTNGEDSGVYDGDNKVGGFPQPDADVTIPDVEIGLKDNYTYLGAYMANTVTEGELINETTIKYKGTDGNYYYIIREDDGTTWKSQLPNMSDYVDITVDLDLSDDDKEKLKSVMDDMNITVKVTIKPKYEGVIGPKEKTGDHKLNVFKPEVTYQDSEINLGDAVNYEDNFVSVMWKHGGKTDDEVRNENDSNTATEKTKIFGDAPTLTYTYDPVENAFTSDTFVAVNSVTLTYSGTGEQATQTVTINRDELNFVHIAFVHKVHEDENCQWNDKIHPADYNFIVHVKSFDLTIKKVIPADSGFENQSFLFKIERLKEDGSKDNTFAAIEVVITGFTSADQTKSVTIKNLPAGNYTVTEETSWSWRYTPDGNVTAKTITAANVNNGVAEVTFTNKLENSNWIDGNTYCRNKWNDSTIERTPQKN